MKTSASKTIILTGGGTAGPVTPLLGLVDDIRRDGYEPHWIGTRFGLERSLVEAVGLPYYWISAGKWRRYFSWQNFLDPFRVIVGFFEAYALLLRLKPRLVMSAGGFVSVPVVWAAWLLRCPVIIHQQDVLPGLANRLMASCATVITVTFAKSLADYGKKAVWTGNPVRPEFREVKVLNGVREAGRHKILIVGGGTGSEAINSLVNEGLPELTKLGDVTHVTGQPVEATHNFSPHYHPYRFLDAKDMAQAMAEADIVVSRAGLGSLSELAYLHKVAVLIPMPQSHQEMNAQFFAEQGAAIVLSQADITGGLLAAKLEALLADRSRQANLQEAMGKIMKREAHEKIYEIMREIIDKT